MRQQPRGNSDLVSVNTAVAMRVGDDVVGIYSGHTNPVNINGEFIAIKEGEVISVGGGSVFRDLRGVYIVTNENGDGFWARVGTFIGLRPFLSTERTGEIAGLLGNADGDKTNDIALADGTVLTGPLTKQDLYGAYADSWRVTPETSLFIYGEGESTETFTNRDFPSRIVTINDLDPAVRAAAEDIVRGAGLIEGTIEFENALLDVALTGEAEFAQAAFDTLQAFGSSSIGLALNAGGNAQLNEGDTFNRLISFTDDADSGNDGRTYSIDWGDGSPIETGAVAAGGFNFNINHLFTDGDANHTVSITVTDGSDDSATQQFTVNVGNIAPTIALSGAPETNTGVSYILNLGAITDPGLDTVTSYIVNWGDGGSDTYNSAGEVTHTFAVDGNYTISVDLVDEDGMHTAAGTLAVAVNTVIIPDGVAVNAGVDAVINEGSLFTRTITFSDGEDAGADGWTYSVDWGDGSAVEMGNIAAGANSFDISRFFADGDASHTVSVTVTDTTGDTNTRQFVLGVNNVAPVMTLIGDASVDEGSVYTLTGSVFDPGADTVTDYIINWGDGTTTALTAVEVQALSGNVTHVFADGASNPQISVDLVDEDGTHAAAGTLSVTVNNVAPTIALSGAAEVNAGDSYLLNLGAITDPGDDTVTNYIVNWGDGNVDTFSAAGDVTHVYATTGSNTISVDLVDEDGMHTNAGSLAVMINDIVSVETVRIGDAPARISNLSQLVDAWSDPLLGSITHKSNATNLAEAWSTVTLTTLNSQVLAGGDLYAGDLGVSGRSVATNTIAQELDGTETLRFEFTEEATAITVSLSRLYSNDSGGVFNESGRIRLLDSNGNVVGETTFVADALNGQQTISLASDTKFTAVEFNAGAYDGDLFIYGALAEGNGEFGTGIYADTSGKLYGSDFLVDWIEPTFEISLIGATTDNS